MLAISLFREVPEQLKPRKIEIGQYAPSSTSQGEQKQISQPSNNQAKAA